jgi:hypothetical protein
MNFPLATRLNGVGSGGPGSHLFVCAPAMVRAKPAPEGSVNLVLDAGTAVYFTRT